MFPNRQILWPLFSLLIQVPLCAADNPRHVDLGAEITSVQALTQNWSDEEANCFYNVPQGSRLIPYDWFLHLEQSGTADLFREREAHSRFGVHPTDARSEEP